MNEQEAKVFYKKQFELSQSVIDLSTLPSKYITEMIEQVSRDFSTVLELGAGNGALARGISPYAEKITTIELVPAMVTYANAFNVANITSLAGSFYDIELPDRYDVVLYIDGFGVGSDDEQLLVLRRIYNWLKDDGVALIDVYQPHYWEKISGETMTPYAESNITRTYGYNQSSKQMTDTWWHNSDSEMKYTQILACYSPDEMYALCEQASLKIIAYYPAGAMDFENWTFDKTVSLSECLSYRIKVVKKEMNKT